MQSTKAQQAAARANGTNGPVITTETITPAKAKKMLEHNTRNRNLRDRHVVTFAAAMSRGEWRFVGDPIRFAQDGTLLDGQHRLAAVVKSGVTIQAVVMRGLELDAQEAMDHGARRTFSDLLRLRGEHNTSALASACRYLWVFRQFGSPKRVNVNPTTGQLLEVLDKTPQLRDALPLGKRMNKQIRVPGALWAVLYVLFCEADSADADMFFDRLASGEGLQNGDPIFAVRRILLQRTQSRHQRTSSEYYAALIVKAFNYWREGRTVAEVRWRAGGAAREDFPEIIKDV